MNLTNSQLGGALHSGVSGNSMQKTMSGGLTHL